ncbi:MAG: hypothetical protein EON54_07715 [Alcaligenaceae bacterium]|nr:MAG: hypothetical protein EON54_07715 [Alcaligenaceae bacterium]
MKFVVIPELRGRWRWEFRNQDRVLASSAMSFGSREMALVSIKEFRNKAPLAPIQKSAASPV